MFSAFILPFSPVFVNALPFDTDIFLKNRQFSNFDSVRHKAFVHVYSEVSYFSASFPQLELSAYKVVLTKPMEKSVTPTMPGVSKWQDVRFL